MTAVLSARGLSKTYGAARVLNGVDLELTAGEIHALVGENGAGKSTLIKILSGAVEPDAGEVWLGGTRLPHGDPLARRRGGISIVYQEFSLVPELSVADNVLLGRELGGVFLRRADARRRVAQLLDELGVRVDVTAPVRELSVAQQQLVEIARALVDDAQVLMLDEPTASLSGREIDRLMTVIRNLKSRGLAILYVSHRLDEIFTIADRLTVLRDGARVTTSGVAGLDRAQLIRWMVGRDVSEEFPERRVTAGAAVLEIKGLASPPRFSSASLTVREREIVGLAGLVGAGRTSTALAIAGALRATGEMRLDGRPASFASPTEALDRGIAYVTEDRKARGVFSQMSTSANVTMTYLRQFAQFGVLDLAAERRAAVAAAREFDVRVAGLAVPAGSLSGGNQQKMLLARALLKPRRLLILDEPTRGVDVGARGEIYALMNRLTQAGLAILMISSDLPELLGMSDRVVVMRDGQTRGELTRAAATPEAVMALAAHA